MKKLNKGNASENTSPYNEIYESFPDFFDDLMQSRHDNSHECYVRNKEIENRIFNYIKSPAKPVCLFSGLTGIGKTSVLNFIKNKLENRAETHYIHIDLLGSREGLDLGEDFHDLDEKKSMYRAEKIAENFIISVILGSINEHITNNEWNVDFFDFLMNDMPQHIADLSIHTGEDEYSKRKVLEKFRQTRKIAHAYGALKFFCSKKTKNQVVIIVDNTDQKDFEIIEAFVKILGDFNHCIARSVSEVTSIISCRPYNEKRLQKRRNKNTLDTHGDKTIEITRPCKISDIILARKKTRTYKKTNIHIHATKGSKWSISDAERFIENLAARYEEEGLGDFVVKLNNYDVSLAFDNTLHILRNRFFVPAEKLMPIWAEKDDGLQYGLSKSAVLKSLAYGNPGSREIMFYPQNDFKMPIPNLFNWNPSKPETFLSKYHVIQYLIKRKAFIDRKGVEIEEILQAINKFLGITDDIGIKCLVALYDEKLIFTHSNRPPVLSPNGSADYIVISPKGRLLDEISEESSYLVEFWFDDTPLDSNQFNSTFLKYNFSERAKILIEFISFIWEKEKFQLDKIIRGPTSSSDYVNQFGDEFASKKLLNGVRHSLKNYYKTCDEDYFRDLKEKLNQEMVQMKNVLLDEKC